VFALIGFVLVESRLKDPLIQLKMFAQRNLASGAIINLFIGFCLMIGLVTVPILVNVRVQDSTQLSEAALQTGILLSALTVPMALAAIPGGWLSDRIGFKKTTMIGLVLAMIGFTLVWQTWTIDMPNGLIAVEMIFIGVGIGLTFSPISAAVINSSQNRHIAPRQSQPRLNRIALVFPRSLAGRRRCVRRFWSMSIVRRR